MSKQRKLLSLLALTVLVVASAAALSQASIILWEQDCPSGFVYITPEPDGHHAVCVQYDPTVEPSPTMTLAPTKTPTLTLTPIVTATATITPTATATATMLPTLPPTETPTPVPSGAFVVDHTNIDELWQRLRTESAGWDAIIAASHMHFAFADRSVGYNISDGLTCLSYDSVAAAPNTCKRPDPVTADFDPDYLLNRANWDYLLALTYADYPLLELNQYDVVGYLPNYLEWLPGSRTSPATLIFTVDEVNHGKPSIWFTSSLARVIGTSESMVANNMIRQFAIENGHVLVDVADIESHSMTGEPCLLDATFPIICSDYTSETVGGHLGNMSTGAIRLAKAIWIAMAYHAGWRP